ncbi:hypothetical protein O3597_19370 [Verrucosispora sp. WMMA2044]|uniref:hypothetical protein n=1 Tax=Verrucosispora sp. WMMA2044 TaxID=3016419 RepID=UPI00248C4599|nr:hypothetical protein [Verrucosispora sp. WMMA2044]WBB47299.1 hypothetical protein O3597_19370 [Verrucosispora sp. WMMA2044]
MSSRTGASAFLAVVLSVVLAGCGTDGGTQPPAVSQSPSPATAAPAASEVAASVEPESAPVNPVEVLARNTRRAYAACGGCGGVLALSGVELQAAIDSLVAEHSKQAGPALTRKNAELALYGPAGATPKVAGDNVQGYDVLFYDASGKLVLGRQIKTFAGKPNQFPNRLRAAAPSMEYDGELLVQVAPGVDAAAAEGMMRSFWGNRSDARLAVYQNMWVAFRSPDGRPLGLWMPGARGMGVPG